VRPSPSYSGIAEKGPIRGIVYDLDGTLYTISWLRLNITMGMLLDTKRLRCLFEARDAIRDRTFADRASLYQAFAVELATRAGGTPEQVLSWYETRFMPRFVQVLKQRGRAREGLVALLERVRGKGVRQAVVSDFGLVSERLRALGIPRELFDDVVGADEFGVLKPSALPYRHLIETWGLVPAEVLLVGDRRDQDEASATLAGTDFVGVAGEKDGGSTFLPWPSVVHFIDDRTG
jgi:FMN phosphatase YigB (HAD superfamily)